MNIECRRQMQTHMKELLDRDKEYNKNRYGWRRYTTMSLWHSILLGGYLGWDVDEEDNPSWLKLQHIYGEGVQSDDILRSFDDEATGLFYSRDHTSSGIPFCNDGDVYWSSWWFQFKEDFETFREKYKNLVVESNR